MFTVAILTLVAIQLPGCSPSSDRSNVEPPPPKKVEALPVEDKPDPKVVWNELIEKASAHLEADELDETQQRIAELDEVYAEPDLPSEEQQSELADLKRRLADNLKLLAVKQREENLVDAEKLMNLGKLTEARQMLSKVSAFSPTDEQRAKVRALEAEIGRRSKARRDLQYSVRLLRSDKSDAFSEAKNNLLRQRDIALGMMLEASASVDEPILAANSLKVLTLLRQPKVTLPAMIDVLRRTEQQRIWPTAIQEIVATGQPGAGQPLLELALSSALAEQRIAALTALSQVIDPPNQTVVVMLPLLQKDGPELATALRATYHALTIHNQQDLQAHRGLDDALTAEQEEQLTQLPERLAKLIEMPADDEAKAKVVQAAKVLACATRQIVAEPLGDVKVLRAAAEVADGPATAVLDGVWNSVELNTIWRHPVPEQSTITLDLGQSRTVVGVRVWNFNQASGAQRGWKEVDIFVSDSPLTLKRNARGIIPTAPGAADTPDYSTIVPVPFVRGRYVRLQAHTLWTSDTHTGVSEIQVLGF